MKRLCDDRLRVFYGDLACSLPHGHEGNHRGTSRYDSRYVWWTPTSSCPQKVSTEDGDT